MPLHVSNVAFYDPSSKKGIRVGYTFNKEGKNCDNGFSYNSFNNKEYLTTNQIKKLIKSD